MGIFLLISVIAALVLSDEVDIEVKNLHWQRSIQIEQKVTVNESDWSLPEGGRLREKRKKPIYKNVPVYETTYYYTIERWKSTRTVDTQGDDKKPYWGDYELAKGSEPYGAGEERVAGQTETLTVTGIVKDKEKDLYSGGCRLVEFHGSGVKRPRYG